MQALKLCLDRLLPPRRDAVLAFTLPKMETPADAVRAIGSIVDAVANGEMTRWKRKRSRAWSRVSRELQKGPYVAETFPVYIEDSYVIIET